MRIVRVHSVRTVRNVRAHGAYFCALCIVRRMCTHVRTFFVLTNFKRFLVKIQGFYENLKKKTYPNLLVRGLG